MTSHDFTDFVIYLNGFMLDRASGPDFGIVKDMGWIWCKSLVRSINSGEISIDESSDTRLCIEKLRMRLASYDDDEWHTLWPVVDNSVPLLHRIYELVSPTGFKWITQSGIPIYNNMSEETRTQLINEIEQRVDNYIQKNNLYSKSRADYAIDKHIPNNTKFINNIFDAKNDIVNNNYSNQECLNKLKCLIGASSSCDMILRFTGIDEYSQASKHLELATNYYKKGLVIKALDEINLAQQSISGTPEITNDIVNWNCNVI